ncbi:ABC-2 type transporter-domain-containing protein [Boletus coccyginus]|nr:ABC-2 type transporter-domain-containing protein [Boletus coccyginus]
MRKLGVMFRDLRVMGVDVGAAVQHNLVSLFYPKSIIQYIRAWWHPPVRDIISGFEGVVLPGEMLLVLGRPGSGCSTFLKTIANHRGDYFDVLGDVFYDSFSSEEIKERYRGDVVYCPEDDVHFPTLKVWETLEFASMMRTPSSRAHSQSRSAHAMHTAEALMRIFGLERARDTVVGNASLRGISGGEKKRVSLAEVMSARGKIVCWDNATRGLDSSTALEFIRTLRIATDTANVTTVVSILQAGEQLFDLFDKVCLIYEGKMAYFGPAKEAKRYFMDMGYEPQNRQTTPDFLVAVTDPHGRKIRSGFQGVIPRTADEMAGYFRTSAYGQLNHSSTDSYYALYVDKPELKRTYDASASSERARHAPNGQSYILSVPMQVRAVMRRRWRILKGSWATQAVQVGSQSLQAVFAGTVFFQLANNTSAYFSRASLIYFTLFCCSTLSMAEIPSLFSQRLIVLRHQKGALYYPFIEGLAHTIVDIPISFISVAIMSIILYFSAGLQKTAEQFLTFLLFTFTVMLVMKTCFRAIAAFSTSESAAVPVAGLVFLILILYADFLIPVANIVGALHWITYVNPLHYAFESLMVNEFHTLNGMCTTLVPSGPGYGNVTLVNQVCTTVGSQPGMATVPGDIYAHVSFGYSHSNLWKNFGILCIFIFGLLGILLFFTQYNKRTARDTTVTLYKQGSGRVHVHQVVDEEKVAPGDLQEQGEKSGTADSSKPGTIGSEKPEQADIFSWKNIQYEVPVSGGEMRKLLDDVSGYVVPGKLTALMGETGAGKTVLLNVLSQHLSVGVVRGDCLLSGHPLPADFRSQTAYVQQMDTHIPGATVREALLFSARLRQPPSVSAAEKEAYVDKCLKMCGLESHADAIVGSLGVEHRKRVTIGVELAAKPKLLLFLDEPTSGLDSRSSWAVVAFLRALADNGQAILCTIHQPSGDLFQVFDRLLLLRKGGQTIYFGDIGERSMTMIEYFQRNGAPPCAADANPAEYMLDVIGAGATATCATDWHQVWKDSPEAAKLDLEIDRIHREGRSRSVVSTGTHPEFASSWMKQLALLVHRGFVCNWRNLVYVYAKLIISVCAGLIIGFTFSGATNSLQGYQDKLFSVFLVVAIYVALAQQVRSKFLESRTVYEVRERPARMFTWSAFLVSEILNEIPWNMLGSSLVFFCWYWTSGFDSSGAGFFYFFYCVVFPLYYTTFGLAIMVISPNGIIASALFSLSFSFVFIFAGILQPYSQLGWWRWMYHVSPFTYIMEGLLGQALGNQLVTCMSTELVTIEPPPEMSCSVYMDPYITYAGGYLVNPNATAACAFCPFRMTDAYLQLQFHISYAHRWRDLGIVLGVVVFNVRFHFSFLFRLHSLGAWLMLTCGARSCSCLQACTFFGYARACGLPWHISSAHSQGPSESAKPTP